MWPHIHTWATNILRAAILPVFVSAGALPADALAHAALTSSIPASNQVLEKAPRDVELHFNEPVRVIRASLSSDGGAGTELAIDGKDAVVRLSLPPSLPEGAAIVSYRVVSEDGHPVGGSLVFFVGSTAPVATTAPTAQQSALAPMIWIVHTSSILFLAISVGGALFNRWLDPSHDRRKNPTMPIVSGGLLLAAGVYLQGLDEIGAGLTFKGLTPLATALRGNVATASLLAFLSLALVSLPIRGRRASLAAALLAMTSASAAFTFTGHCNVVSPLWLARACIFLHGAALLFWIGSLLPLWRLGRTSDGAPLQGFSRAIPLPFALLLAAGATLALLELPSLNDIPASVYGRILLVKTGLVAVLCVVAIYNRFWLTRPALGGSNSARRSLRRSIAVEMLLATAIVASASLWRFAGPGQLQYTAAAQSVSMHLHSERAMAQVELLPAENGTASLHVAVLGPDFDPIQPQGVSLLLSNAATGIEGIRYDLTKSPEGTWETGGLPISDPRGWRMELQVLIDDFTSTRLEGDLTDAEMAPVPEAAAVEEIADRRHRSEQAKKAQRSLHKTDLPC